ncbi:MAG: NYN domain-containing protein [Nitrospira defluvii]|nr:NYN domain-containing protein [Nitrospira defluvii]
MATHLLVDGYNLVGSAGMAVPAGSGRLEAARETLLKNLAGYRQRKGHAITVVFDGWQGGLGAEHREFHSGVEVVYSKRGERADQVIQRLARLYGRECAVVSSDHEVVNAARAAGAFVIGAAEFRAKLQDRSSSLSTVAFKELDRGEHDVVKRSKDKGGESPQAAEVTT